ncbi:MAG: ABC transporter permease [Clostridiales bacterium]|nr:ABC transporter permease [Clostridiales bacterium]
MRRYIIMRLLWVIPVMLGVLVIVFTITYYTPGDPVMAKLGADYDQEQYDALAAQMGLDKGFFGQLVSYIWNLVTKLDFGKSYITNLAIKDEITARMPVSFGISMTAFIIGLAIGIPLGILSAVKQYSVIDITLTASALFLAAIPGFVLALLCLLLFGVTLRWLPVSGLTSFKHLILPVGTSVMGGIAAMMRMTRTTMLEVIRQDYIRTARAKGLREGVILRRHALKNCMIPLVTVIGGAMAMTIMGSVIVETLFGIPGMGLYMTSAINSRDYSVVNAIVLIIALVICLLNLLVDIAYAFIDPRIKSFYVSPKKGNANDAGTDSDSVRKAGGGA